MKPYVSAIILGVRDLNRATRFYSAGLGWWPRGFPGSGCGRLEGMSDLPLPIDMRWTQEDAGDIQGHCPQAARQRCRSRW
jgi:hypothetical protein